MVQVAPDPVGFRRVGDRVEMRGKAANPDPATATGATVFTLPEGFRPLEESHFTVNSGKGKTIVTISPDGSVLADAFDGWVNFNGISFVAEEGDDEG